MHVIHKAFVDEDFGAFINPVTKHVASHTLKDPLDWDNSRVIDEDLLGFVRRLKEGEGGDVSVNGISIVRQLLDAGLLDELTLTVHPVLVGQGRRLFEELAEPFRLDLVGSQVTSVGNAMLTYAEHT